MDSARILTTLKSMSPAGKRVALLIAYLSEFGAKSKSTLARDFPNGLKSEVELAITHGYVGHNHYGELSLKPKAVDVIHYVTGQRGEPLHWKEWDEPLRVAVIDTPAMEKPVRRILRVRRIKR